MLIRDDDTPSEVIHDIIRRISSRLVSEHIISDEHEGDLELAILDIYLSTMVIFVDKLPLLDALCSSSTDIDEIQDVLFELRDEFRHIEYHIRDARLADIEWPNLAIPD